MKLKYRKGIFLVVYKKEKAKISYLLLKRKLHWVGWEFPKGGVEKRESLIEAARRELLEETGLSGRLTDMKKKSSFLYPSGFRGWPGFQGMSYHVFAVEVKSKKIKLDKKEHITYSWLEYKKARNKLTHKNQKQSLKIVNHRFNKS